MAPSPTTSSKNRKCPSIPRLAAAGLLLVGAVIAAYFGALRGEFLWDDDLHITANPTIIGPLGLKEIWTSARANYFPLVLTNFWVQHRLWGLEPFGYHAVTMLMHALAALLLWRVLRRLGATETGSWLGAALWALHPVQVESVAWICELKNTQSAVFFLAAILFFLRWLEEREQSARASYQRYGYYIAALGTAVAALLSKPSTVMLPVALLFCSWWKSRTWRWKDVLPLLPFFALSALAAGWTIWEQKFHSGAVGAAWAQSFPEKLAIAGRIVWFYLGKLAWPEPLLFIYPRWEIDPAQVLSYGGAASAVVVFAAIAWLALKNPQKNHSAALFCAAGFFGALLFPVLGFFNIYFFRYSYVGDHFQYLASMGPLALAGVFLGGLGTAAQASETTSRSTVLGRIGALAGVCLVVAFGILTARQTSAYANNIALWTHTLERNPQATMAWVNLADALKNRGRYEEAIAAFRKAIEQRPQDSDNWNDLGATLCLAGRDKEAVPVLEHARSLVPNDPVVHDTLGNALYRLGRAKEAVRCFQEAVRLAPSFTKAQLNLGRALVSTGRARDAIAPLTTAALKFANDFETQSLLGIALVNCDRLEEAVAPLQKAVQLKPDSAVAHQNLGQVLIALGRYSEGRKHLAESQAAKQ